jgi:hypothetical protein
MKFPTLLSYLTRSDQRGRVVAESSEEHMADEYWYLKCTVCSHFHRGDRVNRGGPTLNVPMFDAEIACPNLGGKADYNLRDWRPMTEAQWQELERSL